MAKKQDKNFLFKICELLATIGILGNTLILIIFQNTWTYEELPILKFEPTPKSILCFVSNNPLRKSIRSYRPVLFYHLLFQELLYMII